MPSKNRNKVIKKNAKRMWITGLIVLAVISAGITVYLIYSHNHQPTNSGPNPGQFRGNHRNFTFWGNNSTGQMPRFNGNYTGQPPKFNNNYTGAVPQ